MKGISRYITLIGMLLALLLPGLCSADPLAIGTAPLLPAGTVDASYTEQFLSATGGTSPYSWKATGILPPGIAVATTGSISGTPTSGGVYTFQVTVTDATLATASKTMQIDIVQPAWQMPTNHPTEYSNCAGCHTARQSGEPDTTINPLYAPPSATNKNLADFVFSADREVQRLECSLDGAPFTTCASPVGYTSLAGGSHTFMVRAIGNGGDIESSPATHSWTIYTEPLVLVTTSLPDATVGVPYEAQLIATGGVPPLTWYIPPYFLPGGLDYDPSTGIISGTPTDIGTTWFDVSVTDSSPAPATLLRQLTITVNPAPLAITTSSLPTGTVNTPYSALLEATGGQVPYTWSVNPGSSLPAGLALSLQGMISGTSTVYGSFPVTFRVRDGVNTIVTKALTINVSPPPLSITTASLPSGTVGAAYTATLAATGGTTPYTWSIDSGTLPAGLTLNGSTGEIAGTPSASGTFPVTFRVTDGVRNDTKALLIDIAAGGSQPVRVPYTYTTVQQAFTNVVNEGTIQVQETTFAENIVFNRPSVAATLKGGYNIDYSANPGITTIQGTFTVQHGGLTIEKISIR